MPLAALGPSSFVMILLTSGRERSEHVIVARGCRVSGDHAHVEADRSAPDLNASAVAYAGCDTRAALGVVVGDRAPDDGHRRGRGTGVRINAAAQAVAAVPSSAAGAAICFVVANDTIRDAQKG